MQSNYTLPQSDYTLPQSESDNLNKQIRISDVLSVLITQSTKLIEIVNANQKEVNRLKKELEQLKTHTDNV